jgi:hypothetical protein
MLKNYHKIINLPKLDDCFIQEALTNDYRLVLKPDSYRADATLFNNSNFAKLVTNQFDIVDAVYLKTNPMTLYDWHVDKNRTCSLNWVIKTNSKAMTLYRESVTGLYWNIDEVEYDLYKPTLLNTKVEHCVINNFPEDRIILSMSFWHPYETVLSFLKDLSFTNY